MYPNFKNGQRNILLITFLIRHTIGIISFKMSQGHTNNEKVFKLFWIGERSEIYIAFLQKGIKNCLFTTTYGNLHRSENMAVYCILKVAVHSSGYLSKIILIKSLILKNINNKKV